MAEPSREQRSHEPDRSATIGPATEIAQLRTEVAELRALLAHVVERVGAAPRAVDAPVDTPVGGGVVADRPDRRTMLRRAGGLAGGAAVAAMAGIASAEPAAAVNGNNVVAGQATTASASTILSHTTGGTNAPSGLVVVDAGWTGLDPGWALFTLNTASISGLGGSHLSGVHGSSYTGATAGSAYGAGVLGTGIGTRAVGMRAYGLLANLALTPVGEPPKARTQPVDRGFVIVDENTDLWFCTAEGTPGTWRKVAGPSTAGALHVLSSPARVWDSRAGNAPLNVTKGKISNGAEVVVDAKNGSGIPNGATAVVLNVTVTNTSAAGWLSLFKNGIGWPGTSTVNWSAANTTLANLALVATDASSRLKVRCAANASTDFIVDVVGYHL